MAKQMILSRSRFQLLDVYSSLVNPTDEFGLYVCAPQQEEEDGGGCGGGGGGVGEEDNIMPYSSSSFLFMQPVMHGRVWYLLTIFYITILYARDVPFGGDFTHAARHQGWSAKTFLTSGRRQLLGTKARASKMGVERKGGFQRMGFTGECDWICA